MSKILTISIAVVGILLLFNIVGFNPPVSGFVYESIAGGEATDSGKMIDYSETDSRLAGVESYPFWVKLLAILSALGTVGIIIGTFTRAPPIEYVTAPFVLLIATPLITDLLWLLSEFWKFGMPYNMIGILIFAPLIVGLIISLIEWWRFGS